MSTSSTYSPRSIFTGPRCALALLLLFHMLANIWWLANDNHPVRTDEETHMFVAQRYYDAFFSPAHAGNRLAAILRVKPGAGNPVHPPLLHVAAALMVRVIGYSIDHLAFFNTLMFLAALVGIYLVARSFLTPYGAVFAATVVSFTPVMHAASRYFMTDYLSMTLTVWAVYTLIRSERFTNTPWCLAFGAVNGLGILARATTPVYYLAPCLIAGTMSLASLIERRDGWRFNQAGLYKIIVNGILIAAMSIAIFSPWYAWNGKNFANYWLQQHRGGSGGPLAIAKFLPAAAENADVDQTTTSKNSVKQKEEEEQEEEENSAASAQTTAPPPASVERTWKFPLRRELPWIRYPVYVINNGVFLPLFAFSLLGLAAVLVCKKYRDNLAAWYVAAWLLGSYALLTLLFSFGNPRYALQATPALSLLAAMAILAIPWRRCRLGMQIIAMFALLFQYGNLAVCAYGDWDRLKLPIILDKYSQDMYDDPGLFFYKSRLGLGFSYARLAPPLNENYKDDLFMRMLQSEHEHPRYGLEAAYARLNIRGMMFDERHYWPDREWPNPFRRTDIPDDLQPYRIFQNYGWGKDIDAIIPVLSVVDYVAYTTEDVDAEKEAAWSKILEGRGFELVERFHQERFGAVGERDFGLFARRPQGRLPEMQTTADIDALLLPDLYNLVYSAEMTRLPETLKQHARQRLTTLFKEAGEPLAMLDNISFIAASVVHDQDEYYVLRLIFKVDAPISQNYRLYLEGLVAPEHADDFVENNTEQQVRLQWSYDPTPKTTFWPTNGYVIARYPLTAPNIPLKMRFTFYTADAGVLGSTIDLGTVDFSKVPLNTLK